MSKTIKWFAEIGMGDVAAVGGKNASLGEMISNLSSAGIQVPDGFATSADAFWEFIRQGDMSKVIFDKLKKLDVENVVDLTQTGREIRQMVLQHPLPDTLKKEVTEAYGRLCSGKKCSVAVRSSATAEDLPEASFAGQQETYLNVCGTEDLLAHIHQVYASLYNDRAIAYRVHQGFAHEEVALSAGVQKMVRSDLGASGVMFSIDTESGFADAVLITSAWGLGECVVQGSVNPDEFFVYKPALNKGRPAIIRRIRGSKLIKMVYTNQSAADSPVKTVDTEIDEQFSFSINDEDVTQLAKMAVTIERHYGRAMDIEWGKDGKDGKLYILQARPETVKGKTKTVLERYQLNERSTVLVTGRSIGQRIGSGKVRVVPSIKHLDKVKKGDVLVTDMTDPDWEPVMKRAAAIITNRGGRTCHAAIIARELGVPAIVGCGDVTEKLVDGTEVTASCAEGDTGYVYDGLLDFIIETTDLDRMPELPFKVMMNVGNPERAFAFATMPNAGVGLARLEFVINNTIGIHPKALMGYSTMPDEIKRAIDEAAAGYAGPVEFYVEKLIEGIASLGAAFNPKPVIVRLSDFKSNEYANMIGGRQFEPDEENPMIGFRGASRYIDASFRDCFAFECQALKKVRDEMGLTNVEIMIPFVRTLDEARQVIELLAENGLERGQNGLRVIMMCEIPSNVLLADEFLEYFDGFSIGSNDLTQLTLGLDRDSGQVAHLFDERNPAVMQLLGRAIQTCSHAGKYIGICGQGPSDHPDLAYWLMEQGIDSVSLNPDSVVETWLYLAK